MVNIASDATAGLAVAVETRPIVSGGGALSSTAWSVEVLQGDADTIHSVELGGEGGRRLVRANVDDSALVLGSTQPDAIVDRERAAAAGLSVVRRRSGGGVVLVEPTALLWVEVVIPAGDPLWDDDVSRSFAWLGDAWASALAQVGISGRAHGGAFDPGPLGRLVCFAGRGPGEVFADGRKVVGMSQRRARGWCRIQCAVYRDWDPELLVSMLTDEALAAEASGMERATATELLAGAVQTVEDLDALWQALVEALST